MKKSVIKTVCLFLILVVTLNHLNSIFAFKYGDGIYSLKKYYELEKNTVDVLVLGSSHAFEDVNTATLWENYGIASFDLCGSLQPMWNTYYYLKEALKTQTPKVIVLEAYMTTFQDEYSDDSRIVKNTYGLKWSADKYNALQASVPPERWNEFILTYSRYHSRYASLTQNDFLKNQGNKLFDDWKGFGCNLETVSFEKPDIYNITETLNMTEKTEKYFRMTIELAQENQIPICVIVSPYASISNDEQKIFNTVKEIASEYMIPFINYNLYYDDLDLNFQYDFADEHHLNYSGNQKFSNALGAWLKVTYNVPDHRNEEKYNSWERDKDFITSYIYNKLLQDSQDLEQKLEYMLTPYYTIIMSVDGSCSTDEDIVQYLMQSFSFSSESKKGIWIRDNGQTTEIDPSDKDNTIYLNRDNHNILYGYNNGESFIIIDNVNYKKVNNGVNFLLYNNVTGTVADAFGLDFDNDYLYVK